MVDERRRRDPNCAGLPNDFHTAWAHRDISLRCEVRSLSGHSGHGRAYGWLDLVANDPSATLAVKLL
jgi:hypothetical protein